MPAFSDRQATEIRGVLSKLYGRAIAHKACPLTHTDVRDLLVREEHFQAVEDARELFGNESGDAAQVAVHSLDNQPVVVNFELVTSRDNPGFPFPKYVGQDLYGDPEGHSRKALASWVKWRLKVGRDWCLAGAVFTELNRRCDTPAQVRYFWPSIVGLLAMCEDEKIRAKAEKLRAYKPPVGIPDVDRVLADACKSASAIISKGLLYPEHEGTPPSMSGVVRLSVEGFSPPDRPWEPSKQCAYLTPA